MPNHKTTRLSWSNIKNIKLKFDKPLGGSGVNGVDIIVAELRDNDGVTGLGFSYVIGGDGSLIAKIAQNLADIFLLEQPLLDPASHWATIHKSFNRVGDGPNLLALAALDVALWDLTAKRNNVSLCQALGGQAGQVPVYASGGFSPTASPEIVAETA
ncbi:MAG: hypothetical protein JKY32_15165, partial [Rhizobiales bacterium]|nr:hypothetical protein [Hyphomicrobiales bacterium]